MTWSKHPHLESREWEEDRKPRLDQNSMEIQRGIHGTMQLSPCLVSRIHRDIIWAPLRLEGLDSLSLPFAARIVPLLGKRHLVTSAFLNLRSSWGFHWNLEFTLTASHQLTQGRESGILVPFTTNYCFWGFGDAVIRISYRHRAHCWALLRLECTSSGASWTAI